MNDLNGIFGSDLTDVKKPIKVFARIRPLNEDEIERKERYAVATFEDDKKIKVIDEKHSQETTYHFDGIFKGHDDNEKVYTHTTKPLLKTFLNGINCAVLTYGQTGSGKTYTAMADGCITEFAIEELFNMIEGDSLHDYQIFCSFVQIYLEKVYDLLNEENKGDLLVREHPKKGIFVHNLTHQEVKCREDVLNLLQRGKELLITAETNMVRESSRSHSVFQLTVKRKKSKEKQGKTQGNSAKGNSPNGLITLDDEVTLKSKMQICDLAGSERLGKTMVEGINKVEARHINSSLLELGNVIYSLSSGKITHVPFRNSTLTRLLQECLGSKCLTSFIVCVAPSVSESYETRCSLNFGARARTITNKERVTLNVEVNYELMAKKMSKRIDELEKELSILCQQNGTTNNPVLQINQITCKPQQKTDVINDIIDLKHTLILSELLDTVLETEEEPILGHQGINISHIRLTNMLTIATKRLKNIQSNEGNMTTSDAMSDLIGQIIAESSHKLDFIQEELHAVEVGDSDDLFRESAYTVSETCTDIENTLWDFLKTFTTTSKRINNNEHTNSFYKVVENSIDDLFQSNRDNSEELKYTEQLFHILQILQVIRLFMECNLRKRCTQSVILNSEDGCHETPTNKPFETPSSNDEDSSVIDEHSPIDPTFSEEEFQQQSCSASSKKLTRSPAFKIKRPSLESSFETYDTKRTYAQRIHEELLDEGLSTTNESYSSLQNEYAMLHEMYTNALHENERLKDANTFMQRKFSALVNIKHKELCDNKSLCRNDQTDYTTLYYDEMSYDQLHDVTDQTMIDDNYQYLQSTITNLEENNNLLESENNTLIQERDEVQAKNDTLQAQVDNFDEKFKKLEEELKSTEKKNSALLEQVVYLCSTLDVVKHLEDTRKSPPNKDELSLLESELYFMIDQNVRYESALMEIKFKVTKHVEKINIDSLLSKPGVADAETLKLNKKRSISGRASISRASSPIVKKANVMKKEYRHTVKKLRKENNEHPVTLAKEIKTARTARVKELLQEKLLMTQQISNLEKEIVSKNQELEKSKMYVELLTQEVGQIDLDSMGSNNKISSKDHAEMSREGTFVKERHDDKEIQTTSHNNRIDISVPHGDNEDIEIIQIPEVKYEDLLEFVRCGRDVRMSSPCGASLSHSSDSSLTKRKSLLMKDREFNSLVLSLESTNECLRESNTTLSDEVSLIKSINKDQKEKIRELKFQLAETQKDSDVLRYQLKQIQSTYDSSKWRYEKQTTNMKKQILQLQEKNEQLLGGMAKRYKKFPKSSNGSF